MNPFKKFLTNILLWLLFLLCLSYMLPSVVSSQEIDLSTKRTTVGDVRSLAERARGDIPGAAEGLGGYVTGIHEMIVLINDNGSADIGVQACAQMPTMSFAVLVRTILLDPGVPPEERFTTALGVACLSLAQHALGPDEPTI